MLNHFRIKAFTLIEVMVVVLIVGILATVAVPAYKRFIIRAKIQNAVSYGTLILNKAEAEYALEDVMPEDIGTFQDGIDVVAPTEEIAAIRWTKSSDTLGQVTITLDTSVGLPTSTNTNPDTIWLRVRPGSGQNFERACGPMAATNGVELQHLSNACQTLIGTW